VSALLDASAKHSLAALAKALDRAARRSPAPCFVHVPKTKPKAVLHPAPALHGTSNLSVNWRLSQQIQCTLEHGYIASCEQRPHNMCLTKLGFCPLEMVPGKNNCTGKQCVNSSTEGCVQASTFPHLDSNV